MKTPRHFLIFEEFRPEASSNQLCCLLRSVARNCVLTWLLIQGGQLNLQMPHPLRRRGFSTARKSLRLQNGLREARFGSEIECFSVFDDGCEHSVGRTTGLYHDDSVRNLFTIARISEKFSRSESSDHEPDHYSAQSATGAAQYRRSSNFRSTNRVHTSKDHRSAREVEHRSPKPSEKACVTHREIFRSSDRRTELERFLKASAEESARICSCKKQFALS